jgi:hypothetical protein
MVKRFGRLLTASFIIMGIGIVTFLLVIPLYHYFAIDTDIIGLLIFDIGVVLCIIGIIRWKKLRGFKLAVMVALASVLSLPLLMTLVSLIYYLVTGKPLGE